MAILNNNIMHSTLSAIIILNSDCIYSRVHYSYAILLSMGMQVHLIFYYDIIILYSLVIIHDCIYSPLSSNTFLFSTSPTTLPVCIIIM